ncbi:ankyrin repeat domain-containing protein 24 isoform X5 [Hemicordylus capensis]|uniref:ankyrin repeat domain-containing protein 24 isoform X5 n=1 Tax=Hemicordylus capensis TaxID=884348 RepID=UPI0023032BA9|nr:ankyrin repeat domain-containing protein 24 isoform X5 [Hemicordylus capensis]
MAARYFLGGTMKQICFCAASSFTSQDWSKNDEKLLQAVEYNDADRVSSLLLRKGLVPTKLDSEGKSAFHLAAMRGNVDCLEVMLAHGADAMTTDGSGYAALHLSAKHGHPQCVSKLLQASCPVDMADGSGRTALHHAAINGCISCLEILCDFKAPLNTKDQDGATPLMLAAKMSHSELCHYLLHRGAAVNARDQRGRTALMVACENSSVETVEVLIHGGARVGLIDATGHDAAHYGAATGNALIQHYLQEAAQRRSWASEEESAELSSQSSQQSLSKGKNSSPRKRKAPPPPQSTPNQHASHPTDQGSFPAERSNPVVTAKPAKGPPVPADMNDREAYEEIVRLRQERAQLLQRIRSLEQQQKKQRQERLELEDDSVHTLERQKTFRSNWQRKLAKRKIWGRNWKYYGAVCHLWRMRRKTPAMTLKRCRTKRGTCWSFQVLEKDESDADASGDFIPIILYDSLRSEFDRLKEQYAKAQVTLKALEEAGGENASCKLVPAEAYEQLKAEYEEQIGALREALEKSSSLADLCGREQETGTSGLGMEEEAELLAQELSETQEKYQAALAEVKLLQEQIELSILSVEEKVIVESSRAELETVKAALQQAQEDLKEREQEVRDLEERLEAQEVAAAAAGATQGCSAEAYEEMKASLGSSLDEACREKEALLARCASAEAEVKELRESLEEKSRELEKSQGSLSESQRLQEEAEKLRKQLGAVTRQYEDVKAQVEQLQGERKKLEKELHEAKEKVASQYVSKQEHKESMGKLSASLSDAERRLSELKEKHSTTQKELADLRKSAEGYRQDSVPLAEHARAKEILEGSVWELKAKANLAEQELRAKTQEASRLQAELDAIRQGSVSKEEHKQLQLSLQGEVDGLNAKLSDLGRKHERTCTEVFQVQREALFMKSEKHAAEAQLATAQKQLQSLQAESARIQELHSHIEDSAKLVKEKDKKITELSKEVFKLKEALNDLSELSGQAGALPKAASPQKTENRQEVAALQGKIKDLEQQLVETERRHTNVVSLYRGHLLYAIQGHMDEDIQRILFQILKMQRLQEQGR